MTITNKINKNLLKFAHFSNQINVIMEIIAISSIKKYINSRLTKKPKTNKI